MTKYRSSCDRCDGEGFVLEVPPPVGFGMFVLRIGKATRKKCGSCNGLGFKIYRIEDRPARSDWRTILGFHPATKYFIEIHYRHLAKKAHPDGGGSNEAMAALNRSREQALKEVKS